MKTFAYLMVLATLLSIVCFGCGGSGGSGSSTASVSVVVVPNSVSLAPGEQTTFGVQISGSTDSNVTWSATGGIIDASGNYTAPHTAGNYTVKATTSGGTVATGTVTVLSTAAGVSVSISPSDPRVSIGGTEQFTATVTGSANSNVTWIASSGTIDQTGFYTAPAIAGNYVIIARSQADPSRSATTVVQVHSTNVKIAISPTNGSIPTAGTLAFSATVTGTTNTAVTWSASGGMIDANGNYTAPSAAGSYNITATSQADTTVSATTAVTVVAVGVTVAPPAVSLLYGATQQFTSKVTNSPNPAVTWSASAGTISTSGLFTAPSVAGVVMVTATSVADPTKKGTALVAVNNPVVYTNNFSGTVGSEWSSTTTAKTPSGRWFLGEFGGSNSATLSLSSLPNHSAVTVTFQLFAIQAWQGDAPASADQWGLTENGNSLLYTTFSNTTSDLQAHPRNYPATTESNPGTGSAEQGTLGYAKGTNGLYGDTVYDLTFTFNDSNSALALAFAGILNGSTSTEGWGIAQISVTLKP